MKEPIPAPVSTENRTAPAAGGQPQFGYYRWVICALLFFATTVNYVDRQVIGILARDLQKIIGWTEIDYGNIVAAFNAAYALGLLISGSLIDRFGTKIGYGLAIVVWSIAGMLTALARTPLMFGAARAALGLGESANFPAAIKTVAEWFPKRERAFATGLFNAGTNVGAIVAPLAVPWITIKWGWQWAFVATGAIGFFWLLLWIPFYHRPEKHPHLSRKELDYIRSDPPDPAAEKTPWIQLLPHRQTAAFAIGKYLTDPAWWFYLYWIPSFLRQEHGLDLASVGLPIVAVYLLADIGSIGGGYLPAFFMKHGWSVNRARKTAMLICALSVLPIMAMPYVKQLWLAVGLFGLAAAAHQGWSANIFTTASDMFPRRAVGSVVGVGGMAGAIGGSTMAVATGYILQTTSGNYMTIFFAVGPIYLVALGIIHLLAPTLQPVDEEGLLKPKPLSAGSFLGFGFVGLVLGTFLGWGFGLLSRFSGELLLKSMGMGALLGIAGGIIIGNVLLQRRK